MNTYQGSPGAAGERAAQQSPGVAPPSFLATETVRTPSPADKVRRGWSRVAAPIILLLVASVCFSRALDRSLWLDEAWVANSVVQDTWRGTFFYPDWLQTSPALFLVLVKLAVSMGGESELCLRFVPAALGVAAIVLFWWLAGELLPRPYAFVAALMLMTSPRIPELAQSLKHYSADVFATVVLLYWSFGALRGRRSGSWWAGVAAYVPLSFLSHAAAFCALGLLYANVFRQGKQGSSRVRPTIVSLMAVAGAALANWFLFLRHNRNPTLTEFWGGGFLLDELDFSLASLDALSWPLLNQVSLSPFIAAPKVLGFGDSTWLVRLVAAPLAALCVAGAIESWRSRRGGPRQAIVLALPLFSAFGASLLNLYPWSGRLLTFAAPIVLLYFILGVKALFDAATPVLVRPISQRWADAFGPVRHAAGAACLAIALLVLLIAQEGRPLRVSEREESAAAVAFLANEASPGETIYVDASMAEQFKFYRRRTGFSGNRFILGDLGAPCCRRTAAKSVTAATEREEVSRLLADADLTLPVHSIFTTRQRHMDYLHLAGVPHELISEELAKRGCAPTTRVFFEGVVVQAHLCPPLDGERQGDGTRVEP